MHGMTEFPVLKEPAIIAVLGIHQSSERGFVSTLVGRWAKCSIFDLKGALDSLSEEEPSYDVNFDDLIPRPNGEQFARLHRISFNAICRMAQYHLPAYFTGRGCVIISSTFYNPKLQLDRLMKMTFRTNWPSCRLLIIECRRKNLFQWEQTVQQDIEWKASLGQNPKWHEPTCWKDVENSIQDFQIQHYNSDEYFLNLARSNSHIKKLVVDPFQDLSPDSISLFEQAITHLLIACDVTGPSMYVVEYASWRRKQLEERRSGAFRVTTQGYVCMYGGCIFRFTKNLHQDSTCKVCERRVTRSERAYYCQFCSLLFHESCATETAYVGSWFTSKFPKTHACYSCMEQGKDFSSDCTSCILRTFVKTRVLAPVLNHDCDEHSLSLCVLQGVTSVRLGCCNACGLTSHLASYCCNVCKTRYHWECMKLPLETKIEHGGHLHSMKIQFSCAKEDEYEWCAACFRDIDPETWVYICLECDYVAHLYCLFPSIVEESQYEFE